MGRLRAVATKIADAVPLRNRTKIVSRRILKAASEDNASRLQEILLRHPTSIESCDKEGNSALHICVDSSARYGNSADYYRCARLLIRNGVNIRARNASGKTALDLARDFKMKEFVALLSDQKLQQAEKENVTKLENRVSDNIVDTKTVVNPELRVKVFELISSEWKAVGTGNIRLQMSNRSFIFIDDFNNVLLTEHLYDFDSDATSCGLCEMVQDKNVKIAIKDSHSGALKVLLVRLKDHYDASILFNNLQQCRQSLRGGVRKQSAKK
ncbi:hypothetical protein CAOG_01145 [Capsaspora owczarzaki ATCC 30864]|uniref:Uncharacterized protein n=1 Tax=Capsaspora owczarzaki (strain ATCC 30864) TaxID=595528 RepID=A0A0D2X0V4_CAPO3|nr:hypothetical protein CAOG_01145 [Capsaspora owczarzaki ATCC 30864]KJE89714.1 hypothetical protein CAOG_001145 [Capsaspora owczarzaki ATCC 30864]|eukprot:XP_004366016.1 hypothetical protein CAOG_01145 [Capsaspora owczarzaki ATCC 30864]